MSEKSWLDTAADWFVAGSAGFALFMLAKDTFGQKGIDARKADEVALKWWNNLSEEQQVEIANAGYNYNSISAAFFDMIQGHPDRYLQLMRVLQEHG
ncbi:MULTISPECIES: hypothetical protein [Gimesia]|nr:MULTISPECIES: hypothetical protein [Gimesia]QGQ24675.1 hypothetical protein F1728_19155 [Gimesia benthica]